MYDSLNALQGPGADKEVAAATARAALAHLLCLVPVKRLLLPRHLHPHPTEKQAVVRQPLDACYP
jgi:hypothetical protein